MRVLLSEALHAVEIAKLAANRRPIYVKHLRFCVSTFISFIGDRPVSEVRPEEIESWLLTRGSNSHSRATYLSRLSAFFEFCKRRRWAARNPIEFIERVTIERKIPSVLTPEEARKLVETCRRDHPRVLAWLALTLYAGVRPAEACALSWSDIEFSENRIRIEAHKAKVRTPRFVMPHTICMDLLREAKAIGADLPIPDVTVRRARRKMRAAMGWKVWKADILRHTAASMWLAEVGNAGTVSRQLGNSESVLLRSYWALTSPETAEKFWTI